MREKTVDGGAPSDCAGRALARTGSGCRDGAKRKLESSRAFGNRFDDCIVIAVASRRDQIESKISESHNVVMGFSEGRNQCKKKQKINKTGNDVCRRVYSIVSDVCDLRVDL